MLSDAHHVVVTSAFLTRTQAPAQVLDTKTGRLSLFALEGGDQLEWGTFSDWVDEQGERQVVGLWATYEEDGERRVLTETGMGRFAYPSGRVLDRIPGVMLSSKGSCWYPGPRPRVLFATTDGELYQCAFGAPGADQAVVKPVRWPNPPAHLRKPRIDFVTWPKSPQLEGCVLATVSSIRDAHLYGARHLWWLRLSADGLSVTEAGPLSDDEPDSDDGLEDYAPSTLVRPTGECLLAYQRRPVSGSLGELFVVTVGTDTRTGRPAIRRDASRKRAERLLGMPAAFSPDGAVLYAMQDRANAAPRLCRIPVGEDSL